MSTQKAIACPRCDSTDVENAPLAYQTVKSRDAGQRFILQDPINTKPLSFQKREKLLKKLSPPRDPEINLPAGAIALMAFLISWLATGTLIIGKIGLTNYFIATGAIILIIAGTFYYMLKTAVIDLGHISVRYKKHKNVWEKQYFCHKCENIFIP